MLHDRSAKLSWTIYPSKSRLERDHQDHRQSSGSKEGDSVRQPSDGLLDGILVHGRRHNLIVHLSSVTDDEDINRQDIVFDLVDDPIVSDPDAIPRPAF